MRFQPHTADDVRDMLATMGLANVDALFESIPESLRLKGALDLPAGMDEQSLMRHMQGLACAGQPHALKASFLGAGVYAHYIPQVVDQILQRGEFLTAYTPYQPELAQGTLKAIFEFQTMVAEILEMDLGNASMYDGAHATAEAALMGLRVQRKSSRVLISDAIHPEYREVTRTYLDHMPGAEVEDGSVIGANSLVTGKIPPLSLAAGSPARVIS